MSIVLRLVVLLPVLVVVCPGPLAGDVLMQAMESELARSMSDLRLEGLDKPYFIAYRVDETRYSAVSARFGALESSDENLRRQLTVEVRVGSYDLDNTNYLGNHYGPRGILRSYGGRTTLILDDNLHELRRTLWLATDDAYKEALEQLSRKRAALQNRTLSEELSDFSREEPARTVELAPAAGFPRAGMEAMARQVSAAFREQPEVQTAAVRLSAFTERTRYRNSEGSVFDRTTPTIQLMITASTQAADGSELEDFVVAYARTAEELPATQELVASVREMCRRLSALRHAPPADRYNGPVLVEGQAAAELLAQGLASKLLASRDPVVDDPRRLPRRLGDSFANRIGSRVLPRFLHLVDDPTLRKWNGHALHGSYRVDDEAVPATRTTVIERGFLKTLLSDRTPVAGVSTSTGNRRNNGILPSNVIIRADRTTTREELRSMLLQEIEDRELAYGIVLRRIGNPMLSESARFRFGRPGGMDEVAPLLEAYRVYPDGTEQPIRNAELSSLSVYAFKDILAVSDETTVYSAPFFARQPTGRSSTGIVSWVVPSMLFEDLSLEKPGGTIPRPPVIEHPFFDGTKGRTRPALANVVSVAASAERGASELEVGITSPDRGCEQYADWWEVVTPDGRLVYRRVLRHSHVHEQPFVRSGGPIDVAPDQPLWVRAHMHPTGYGGLAMRGTLGTGFAPADPEPEFAEELANHPPLPDGCAF